MNYKTITLLLMAVVWRPLTGPAQNLVPAPARMSVGEGRFVLRNTTSLCCDEAGLPLARYLADILHTEPADIIRADADYSYNRDRIYLNINSSADLSSQGYRLSVDPDRVIITGSDYDGLFYGIQTLLQLMPSDVYLRKAVPLGLPCVEIEDWPELEYRGVMLDVARTFLPMEVVKKFVDIASRHKINKLHLHLSDDEGWRIEIKSHPELASVGGFRGGDSPIRSIYGAWDSKYGGYYTQKEIQDLVSYAALRAVEVIPEIDLPGHSRAVAAVHPEILCDGGGKSSARGNVWCASREENYRLLSDIIAELCDMFSSEYIHVGGDEVNYGQWMQCGSCSSMMAREGLADGRDVEDYFMSRVAGIVSDNGRKIAVWNEAAESGLLPKQSRVHGWENVEACRRSLDKGYPTVVMPAQYFYFDMRQSSDEPGAVWAGALDMDKVYSFDFAKKKLDGARAENIVGVECALWSETQLSQGPQFLWYQSYPRMCALSEIGWNAARRSSPKDFSDRMKGGHYARLAAMGVTFRLPPLRLERLDKGNVAVHPPLDGCTIEGRSRSDSDSSGWRPLNLIEPTHGRPILLPSYVLHNNLLFGDMLLRAVYKGRGVSPVAAVRQPKMLTPDLKFTASVAENPRYPYSGIPAYKFGAPSRTAGVCREGDRFEFTFVRPVRCKSIRLVTGHYYMPSRCLIDGRAQISYDGETYEDCGPLRDGQIEVFPERPVRSVRLVAGPRGSGEIPVVIYPPKILSNR